MLGLLLLSSCGQQSETKEIPSAYVDVHLELDNGNKWKMSEHMMAHMKTSFDLIENASKSDNVDSQDLANELSSLKNNLIDDCDMRGTGHDQLHSWLMPYIDLLEDLKGANSSEEQSQVIEDLKGAKELFYAHFE